MRTRFLPTDYSATGAGDGAIEALGFVRLPLPDLPPPDYPSSCSNFLQCFDDVHVLGISCEIDKLTIDDALSIFLSDVLPHFIDSSGVEEPMVGRSEGRQAVIHSEEKDGTGTRDKGENGLKFVLFEIPETDIHLLPPETSPLNSQLGSLCILTAIPESECTSDQLHSELALHDHGEIEQLLYSVDEMNVEYTMEGNADFLLEVGDSFREVNSHDIKFPLFEVNVEILDIRGRINIDEGILIFENIRKQEIGQTDEIIRNNKELLGTMEFDLIQFLFHHPVAIQCLEDSNVASQLDLISITELSHCHEHSIHHLGGPEDDLIWSMNPFAFDEFLFFDLNPYLFYEMFSDVAKVMEVETCDSLFGEAMNFRSFSELIVCHELTLMDDSFKALPAPIFSDDGDNYSFHVLVEDLFTQLDWQSSLASDTLYLDWCFLEDDFISDKYSSCQKMLWEIDTYHPDATINLSASERMIFDFIISGAHSTEPNAETYEETSEFSCSDVSICTYAGTMNLSSLRNCGDGKTMNADILMKTSVENVPMLGESMSSDLEFFLNPRNYFAGSESKHTHKSVDFDTACQVLVSTVDSAAPTAATTGIQQKWNVMVQQIWLSDAILQLIDYLWKDFLALLENDEEFIHIRNQFQASNDLKLLHIPNEKFKQRLQEKIASITYLAHNNDSIMALAMLFAIKQMAFCLCFYGIQATYLYADSLNTNLQCMRSRLNSFYNVIRDENVKAETELSLLHPSISVVQEILRTELSDSNRKVLVVCDQVFLWSLKRLLGSLNISFNEPKHLCTPSCQRHCVEITDAVTDIMLNSDCCLVSFEYVSASFPFSKFGFILEYGGSNVSSRISSICPESNGQPTLYFLKVELEGSNIAKALSYGVDLPKSIKLEMKRDCKSASTQKESKTTLEELLCAIPFKETYGKLVEAAYEYGQCNSMPSQSMPMGFESKQNRLCKPFCANTVIIVNTRNFNEEMVISRRSTYQKILALEQEGAQVVERDVGLPVDIILSSAVCLSWYDCRNIGKKVSAPDEAFSCLPLCLESIATSILTSLSFAFSCCILIFEGECSFLCSIMESSDELYAAAASLGIDLQIFCSYSSEMTEEIILSCINFTSELTRGLYPKMSDTESLAESFLTSFPSINPLTAHAILSSDILLGKFLELTNGDRISTLQKYKVPSESIALMSAISRYGEREDSKSGVTDCSSSLSIPDLKNKQFKSSSERRKPNYSHAAYNAGSTEISNRSMELNFLSDEKLLNFSHDIDVNMMKTFDKSSHYDFPLAKGLQTSDERENLWLPQFDLNCSPRRKPAMSQKSNFRRQSANATCVAQENFRGEVIDVEDTLAFQEDLFAAADSNSFSLLDTEKEHSAGNTRMSKQPLITAGLPMFPSPDIGSGSWISTNEKAQTLREKIIPYFNIIKKSNVSITNQKELMEQGMISKASQNSEMLSSQGKGLKSFGTTPLSNALHSTQVQQGSPWTIEFLNRIREKSRLRSQSASYELSSPHLSSSGNTLKSNKRKTPSILEFYKYERGSTPKTFEQKRLKRSSQPHNSLKNKKDSASYPPSWTPVDKRARRTLSFSTNGSGGQSKLVWRDPSQRRL